MKLKDLQLLRAAVFIIAGVSLLGTAAPIMAAQAENAQEGPGRIERLDTALAEIATMQPVYVELAARYQSLAPDAHLERTILHARINRTRKALLEDINTAASLTLAWTPCINAAEEAGSACNASFSARSSAM